MKRTILLYGIALALILFLLQWLQIGYRVRDLSLEVYLGIVALVFVTLGVWAGLRLTQPKIKTRLSSSFVFNEANLTELGISKRELEVLQLMAHGLSNQQIADTLFVSLNTIKTHSSNLFLKLHVNRRTQAIQKAKALMIIE